MKKNILFKRSLLISMPIIAIAGPLAGYFIHQKIYQDNSTNFDLTNNIVPKDDFDNKPNLLDNVDEAQKKYNDFMSNQKPENPNDDYSNSIMENKYNNYKNGINGEKETPKESGVPSHANKNERIQTINLEEIKKTINSKDSSISWMLQNNTKVKDFLKKDFLPTLNTWYRKIIRVNSQEPTLKSLINQMKNFATNDPSIKVWQNKWFKENETSHIIGLKLLSQIEEQFNVINSLFEEVVKITNEDLVFYSNDPAVFDIYTERSFATFERYVRNPRSVSNQNIVEAIKNNFLGYNKSFYDYNFFLLSERKREFLNDLNSIQNNMNGHSHAIVSLTLDLTFSLEFFFKYWSALSEEYNNLPSSNQNGDLKLLVNQFDKLFKSSKAEFFSENNTNNLLKLKNKANLIYSDFIIALPIIIELWQIENETKLFFNKNAFLYN